MKYRDLYERQYGERKLVNVPQRQFWGLRRLLKEYDWDRYTVAEQLIDPGERILDISCGEGYLLRRLEGKFEEPYGLDVGPSRPQEAEEGVRELCPSEVSRFKFVEGNADDPLSFPDNYSDAVTCIAVIGYVYDILPLAREMHRVLKLGS